MTKDTEKRNTGPITALPASAADVDTEGVGGRQGNSPIPSQGGGYPNICNFLNFQPADDQKKIDPRLTELKKIGLRQGWIRVAEEIGFDAFLRVWRILDADPESYSSRGRLEIPLREYSTYLRFQRNRYIETLSDMGLDATNIRERLKDQLREKMSLRHISRIQKRG